MQTHLQKRYLIDDYITLSERVAHALTTTININNDNVNRSTNFALFKNLIESQTFIPAGNTLLAGVEDVSPNCCVLGSLTEENFDAMLELSKQLWRQRTGIGYDLSALSDPVAALRSLSMANDAIELGHRPKRGNMAVLNAMHPRIREFVACKQRGDFYNFNISVAIGQQPPDDALLEAIAAQAWLTGDPGLVFLQHAQNYGPVHATGLAPIVTTVPCGEQFLHAYETCNLGSINLNSEHLLDETGVYIDSNKLRNTVYAAVTLLDTVIDRLVFPSEEIRRVSLDARRIGLGVMGWADYLKRRAISYSSPEALGLARQLSHDITRYAEERSRELAAELGPCAHSTEYRNLSITCIAPTGGITGLTPNKGYSIEPYFEEATQYDYRVHIDMQAAWQSGMHNAVSKTINLPATATVQTVVDAYRYALAAGVKGITVYRDSSKEHQPIALCPSCTV